MPYDDAEAKELFSRHAANDSSNNAARVDAARRLLDDLVKLDGTVPELKIGLAPGQAKTVELQFRTRLVSIGVRMSDGSIRLNNNRDEQWNEISGLRLDLLAKPPELVGEKPDEFLVPVPGQPRQHRSALAVVVEAALTAMSR